MPPVEWLDARALPRVATAAFQGWDGFERLDNRGGNQLNGCGPSKNATDPLDAVVHDGSAQLLTAEGS
jgi:hypothetical protein